MSSGRKVWVLINVMILISKPPDEVLNHFLGNRVLNKIQGWECYAKVIYFPSPFDCPEDSGFSAWRGEQRALWVQRTKFSGKLLLHAVSPRLFPLKNRLDREPETWALLSDPLWMEHPTWQGAESFWFAGASPTGGSLPPGFLYLARTPERWNSTGCAGTYTYDRLPHRVFTGLVWPDIKPRERGSHNAHGSPEELCRAGCEIAPRVIGRGVWNSWGGWFCFQLPLLP